MASSSPAKRLLVALALLLLATAPAAAASGPAEAEAYFPRAGYLSSVHLVARAQPAATAPAVRILRQFRSDNRPTVVYAVAQRESEGQIWYRISLPGRPNGRSGWIRASYLEDVAPRYRSIRIDRSKRTLTVYAHDRILFRTRVAVGAVGMETPRGHFYVTAGFRPDERVLGPWAFETSATRSYRNGQAAGSSASTAGATHRSWARPPHTAASASPTRPSSH